jgi:2-polyprenyl-6-methoxyphenol hydroxylase-like FAD-dependent oxidoreductase
VFLSALAAMKILISGLGIAGPTLAYWLLRAGFEPLLVEEAAHLRTGGYIVDFWGTGYQVAERMGLIARLRALGYRLREVRFVDSRGDRAGGFSVAAIERATHDRYLSIARAELASALYATIADEAEVVFGDSITAIERRSTGLRVEFRHAPARDFDLVIGADGLHSNVRSLCFGPESDSEVYLGYKVAAFVRSGYAPRDENVYVSYNEPGKHVARFANRADRTTFLMVYRDESSELARGEAARAVLHRNFGSAGWECRRILAAMDAAGDIYFDRVSQIRLPSWNSGRVALVGDAAYCPSLLAGEGSSLAMTGAYVLAGELAQANGDHCLAFARYETLLRPLLADKQGSAKRFGAWFAPRTRAGIVMRNLTTRAFDIAPVGDLFLGRTLRDEFKLPDYGMLRGAAR